jgi:hypothetical protein
MRFIFKSKSQFNDSNLSELSVLINQIESIKIVQLKSSLSRPFFPVKKSKNRSKNALTLYTCTVDCLYDNLVVK